MISKDAIQHLQDSANFDLVFKELSKLKSGHAHLVVPEGFQVKDFEAFMECRSSYRASFKTNSVSDFINYVVGFDSDGSRCFIDSADMEANAVFDIGTVEQPGHQRNKASIKLDKTSAYTTLLRYSGERLSQKDFSDWLEDWADHISVINTADEEVEAKAAARAVRNVKVESLNSQNSEVGDYSHNMSELEKMNVSSSDPLPSLIQFTCHPYADLEERAFVLRVSVMTGEKQPRFNMRIMRLETAKEEMVQEFKDKLTGLMKDNNCKTELFIGSI